MLEYQVQIHQSKHLQSTLSQRLSGMFVNDDVGKANVQVCELGIVPIYWILQESNIFVAIVLILQHSVHILQKGVQFV